MLDEIYGKIWMLEKMIEIRFYAIDKKVDKSHNPCYNNKANMRGRGEIGRHARFRIKQLID